MTYKLKNIRVLVIDPNPPIRSLLRNLLLDLGIGMVDILPNTEEAWNSFCQFRQDVLFVDWPPVNGEKALDFVRKIRRDPDSPVPHVPVLLMTGFSNEHRVFLARDAGITEFLIKPFTIQNLVRYISYIVENPRAFVEAPAFIGPDRRRRENDVNEDRRGQKSHSSVTES